MEALTAKAALVDAATLGGAVTTVIPRADIEEALRESDGTTELYLDVKRVQEGEGEEEKRISVSWEPSDLEQVLGSTESDNIALGFKPDELARMFEEPDVEAQGLRERAAILTVAAATAAGATAGIANAMVASPGDVGGGAPAAAFVTDTTSSGPATPADAGTQFVTDATSSGPATPADTGTQFVTDTTSSGPGAVEQAGGTQFITDATSSGPSPVESAATTSGGGGSFISTSGGEAALAGGIMLLIVGAAFAAGRQRQRPKPA